MKITLLSCGSKGEASLTLQTAMFLPKMFPSDEFQVIMAEKGISPSDVNAIKQGNLTIILTSPSKFMCSASDMRILDDLGDILSMYRPVTLLTTSDYCGDILLHDYVAKWADKRKLDFVRSLSLQASDVLTPKGQEELFCWLTFVKEHIEFGATNMFTMAGKQFKVHILDLEPEPDDDVDNVISDYRRDFERYGNIVKVIRLRQFPVGDCFCCQSCMSTRTCVFQDDFDSLMDAVYSGADIIVPVGKLKRGFYNPVFKTLFDRQNQFGRVPDGNEVIWLASYLQLPDYAIGDEKLLEQWLRMYMSFNGNTFMGLAHGYKQSLAMDAMIAAKSGIMPQRDFYWSALCMKYADLARISQNVSPQDYQWFHKNGWYEQAAAVKAAPVTNPAESSEYDKAKVAEYAAKLNELTGPPVVNPRRINKDESYRECHREDASVPTESKINNLLGRFMRKKG